MRGKILKKSNRNGRNKKRNAGQKREKNNRSAMIIRKLRVNKMLDIINVPSHRIAIVRLLCSSHRLRIETGRWSRPVTPRNDRKCETCNKLDDEYHFLLECNLYTDNRNRYIKKYYWRRPSMLKCIELMTSCNKKDMRSLAKYVYKCFSINHIAT